MFMKRLVGIGNAVAKAFAAAGCRKIAITDRNQELLRGTESDILKIQSETQVVSIVGDISSPDFADSLVDETVKKLGRVDYCVNCAGIMGNNQSSTESSLEDFDRINNINYRGLWLSSRAQIKAMLKQEPLPSHDSARPGQRGSIVNIASQLGIVGRPAARKRLCPLLQNSSLLMCCSCILCQQSCGPGSVTFRCHRLCG